MPTPHLGGVGTAHPAAPFGGPLLLIQATPGAVLFWPGNGISEAFCAHRACGTNRLRLAFAHLTLGLRGTVAGSANVPLWGQTKAQWKVRIAWENAPKAMRLFNDYEFRHYLTVVNDPATG